MCDMLNNLSTLLYLKHFCEVKMTINIYPLHICYCRLPIVLYSLLYIVVCILNEEKIKYSCTVKSFYVCVFAYL